MFKLNLQLRSFIYTVFSSRRPPMGNLAESPIKQIPVLRIYAQVARLVGEIPAISEPTFPKVARQTNRYDCGIFVIRILPENHGRGHTGGSLFTKSRQEPQASSAAWGGK
ncbi:uncharacterized protein LOC114527528 [Dendronephthya gigantea]|uniref:uncharacterized protein LOC114527528 n=1 Tax=Dendronephthya gigantea TaxID=151771 RepID=UPI00106A3328|nr:uncharacterized protein LOC114527528 [Dendronephthya gigantea]